jgi:hypothetical protein
MYKLSEAGINRWSDGVMLKIDPVSQADFDGAKEILLIFDKNDVLQAVTAIFHKEDFNNLKNILENKYSITSFILLQLI